MRETKQPQHKIYVENLKRVKNHGLSGWQRKFHYMINCYNHILQDSLSHQTQTPLTRSSPRTPTISPRSPLNITHGSLTRSTDIPLDPSSDIPLGLPGSHSHSLMFTWCSFYSTAFNINNRTIYTSYKEFKIKGNPTPKRTRLTCST